ncbi:hypothetical protein BCM0060_p325 (plasmid) [Bacillus cereus]|nr:hypothetical protein BCM0060_p325 [Bacillus cereus]BCC50619.1 hypothetical protein BCJMU02_p316 [Bacillus cereus]
MIAKAAYRAGEKIYDEKYHRLRNYEGKKKSEEIESAMYLPSHVSEKFKDRNFLYNEIERREGNVSNRQLARELEFSLYTDFTPQENKEMVERFAETFTKDGMIVDACFHKLNDKNPHCHMMLTLRDVNEDGITFGNKNRSWNSDKMHGKWRDTWEKIVNEKFKEKGLDIFVSRKSFEERGIDKKPTKHLPYDKKSAKYQEVLKENKKIKKQNEFKQKKKEIKQEVEQVKEVKQIVRNTKIAGITNNRKEVLGMGLEQEQLKQKPVYEEPGQDPNVYEEPEQSRTVGDLFTESINGLKERYERLNEDTKVLKADKKRSYERYRNHKETDYSKKMSLKKEDVIDMKLDYKMMKVNLKETSVFSLSDWKRRKQLKAAMKKKKIQIKKKKLEMKREKKKLKLYKKEHVKSRNKLLKNYKDKAKTFLLIKKTEREMNKVKNLNKQIDNNKVVSLKDFKKQKMKLELKPQFGKQRDKKLEL